MESQRYLDDFDGIVVGDPANDQVGLLTQFIWDSQALLATSDSYIPPAKLPAITNAALAACDAADGVQDGVISNPRRCHFNPDDLLCTGGDNDSCLTAPQLAALKKIYYGPHNSAVKRSTQAFFPMPRPTPADGLPGSRVLARARTASPRLRNIYSGSTSSDIWCSTILTGT
jgi:hypothetical protein